MRWYTLATFALLLSLAPAARSDEDKDSKSLQGTWLAQTAELGGKPFPDEIRKTIKLTLEDGKYTVSVAKNLDKGTVKLDPVAKPKAMDITGTEGPNRGRKYLAIYELDGDTLKICYDLSGKARPNEFKSTAGSQLFLVTYQREKK
ncbi:MAG: TIGR03067 domain-containing protein [Gemmataceae bacterium]